MKLFKSSVAYSEPAMFDTTPDSPFPGAVAHHGEIDGKFYLSIDPAAVDQYKAAQPEDGGLTAVSTQGEKDKVKAESAWVAEMESQMRDTVRGIVTSDAYATAQALGEDYGADVIAQAKADCDAAIEVIFPSAT